MADNNLGEIDIKICTNLYLDDLININYLNSKKIILEKKSYKDIYRHKYRAAYSCIYLDIIFVK